MAGSHERKKAKRNHLTALKRPELFSTSPLSGGASLKPLRRGRPPARCTSAQLARVSWKGPTKNVILTSSNQVGQRFWERAGAMFCLGTLIFENPYMSTCPVSAPLLRRRVFYPNLGFQNERTDIRVACQFHDWSV